MKIVLTYLIVLVTSLLAICQTPEHYIDSRDNTHLIGPFAISELEQDTNYQEWFSKFYDEFVLENSVDDWKDKLNDIEVDIFMGTWCGDSKKWVPQFIKLWDELELDTDQLNLIGLYGSVDGKYKQGPNHEEKDMGVHRVPTFIFKREGKEIARMVESPRNDLLTDIAQIALGVPSEPNYQGAAYLNELFATKTLEEIRDTEDSHFRSLYRKVKGQSELNTLGYVYADAGKLEEAEIIFKLNMRMFPYEPNVYDSYAETLALLGNKEEAMLNYNKVLLLDRNHTNASEQYRKLKKELADTDSDD